MINLIIRPVTSHVLRSIVGRPPNARKPSFSPLSLFANGEQGAWYDPSDTTTLFQDSAGTIPVTASGQPVGLMLDKSGRGHHATQPTAGSRPIYRRGDSRGVVNLLTWSEAFDNAAWAKSRLIATPNAAPSPSGAIDATRLTETLDTGEHALYRFISLSAGDHSTAAYYKTAGVGFVQVLTNATPAGAPLSAFVNLHTGAVTGSSFGVSLSARLLPSGWVEVKYTAANGVTGSQRNAVYTKLSKDGSTVSYTGDGTSGIYIWRAQLNLGPTALDYQRNDYHLGGVATGASTDLHWLETDGVDDGMVTGNIDFAGTDKVAIFAGLRKLSDAATGVLAGLSASADANHPSTFVLLAPSSGGSSKYNFRSFGTTGDLVGTSSIATPVAPSSNVLTGVGGISTDTCRLRVDGAQVAQTTVDQGTGNFGNYPLYLFSRGVTSLPFNGWFYGLAITGRLTTDAETVATERFLGKKTAVVIP